MKKKKPYARITKALGVTEAGLRLLARAVAHKDGWAEGAGSGLNGTARIPLARDGLITVKELEPPAGHQPGQWYPRDVYVITDAGRALVAKARAMGF